MFDGILLVHIPFSLSNSSGNVIMAASIVCSNVRSDFYLSGRSRSHSTSSAVTGYFFKIGRARLCRALFKRIRGLTESSTFAGPTVDRRPTVKEFVAAPHENCSRQRASCLATSLVPGAPVRFRLAIASGKWRSEEHTSELQSLRHLV